MRRCLPLLAFAACSLLFLPETGRSRQDRGPVTAAPRPSEAREGSDPLHRFTDNADIPAAMLDLMRNADLRYREGSVRLKNGESAKAREAFNAAVDMLLQSGWDLNSTPELNRFFQDLIRRIQTDESRYLSPPELGEEKPDPAVLDELEKLDLIPIIVDPALKDTVEADLASTKYDIPIVLNERVLQSLNYWLSRGRKYFTDGLVRSGRYRDMIERIFREESIPLDIMYLAQVESLFKTNAVSRARAKGIWQFGKGTAVRYGLRVNGYIDERSDPEKSTRAAARYIKDLFAIFRDWNLVLAAYNWGEGKVQRLVDRSGVNDFWSLVDLRQRNFPRETRNHIPLILSSIILARNPTRYGFPTDLDPSLAFARVPVSKPTDLRAAARLLAVAPEELKELNPALRTGATPPGYPDFELKVPPGSAEGAAEKLAALPAAKVRPQPEYATRHRVQRGETLSSIAARYGMPVSALQKANNITSPKGLRTGTWVSIPPSRARRIASGAGRTRPVSKRIATPARTSAKLPGKAVKAGSGASAKPRLGTGSAASRAPARRQNPRSATSPPSPKKRPSKEVVSR